jgi:diaminopimelate decarboxylase
MNDFKQPQHIKTNLQATEMSGIFRKVLAEINLVTPNDTSLIFYDLSLIENRIKGLQKDFPDSTHHAIAAKANPLARILSRNKTLGTGSEVASLPELYLAEKAGFAPGNIVFDSPCKTKEEIEYALQTGVYLNADSFDELDRIEEILKTVASKSTIGLRINPQVGTVLLV